MLVLRISLDGFVFYTLLSTFCTFFMNYATLENHGGDALCAHVVGTAGCPLASETLYPMVKM